MFKGRRCLLQLLLGMIAVSPAVFAEDNVISLFAAGSLTTVIDEIAEAYQQHHPVQIKRHYGPSGLLRQQLEAGADADIFLSANQHHPAALKAQGWGDKVHPFARNSLCAIAQPGIEIDSDSLLSLLLEPQIRLGISTPVSDPSGDYALQMFARAEQLLAGSEQQLKDKALLLTGGPDSPAAPAGNNPYAWLMQQRQADIFLSYCTNAQLARQQYRQLQIIKLPASLEVAAEYAAIVRDQASQDTHNFLEFLLKAPGQSLLQSHGFD